MYRGKFDANTKLQKYAEILENTCISTIESGKMTKDLALLVGNNQSWLETMPFLKEIEERLNKKMNN